MSTLTTLLVEIFDMLLTLVRHPFFEHPLVVLIVGTIIVYWLTNTLCATFERRKQRLRVFETLVASRGDPLSDNHIQAINVIPVVFNGTDKDDSQIRDALDKYLKHLDRDQDDPSPAEVFNRAKQTEELLDNLIFIMSQVLDYKYDKAYLNMRYYPRFSQCRTNLISLANQALNRLLKEKGQPPFPAIPIEQRQDNPKDNLQEEDDIDERIKCLKEELGPQKENNG